jgi:hypothetical protein
MIVVWGNRTLLPTYCFQVTVCLHSFLGNQQCIIIMIVWNMFCLNFTSCPAINRYGRVLSKRSGVYFVRKHHWQIVRVKVASNMLLCVICVKSTCFFGKFAPLFVCTCCFVISWTLNTFVAGYTHYDFAIDYEGIVYFYPQISLRCQRGCNQCHNDIN